MPLLLVAVLCLFKVNKALVEEMLLLNTVKVVMAEFAMSVLNIK